MLCISLWHSPRISAEEWKIAEEWKFVLKSYGRDKNRTGYYPALVQLFSRFSMHSSWEAKQRDATVVGPFIPVSLFVYANDQFANLSAPLQNAMPLDTHESAKPTSVPSSPDSLSNFSLLV